MVHNEVRLGARSALVCVLLGVMATISACEGPLPPPAAPRCMWSDKLQSEMTQLILQSHPEYSQAQAQLDMLVRCYDATRRYEATLSKDRTRGGCERDSCADDHP